MAARAGSPAVEAAATGSALRIGTAPDSWGVWFASHPRQTPWWRFLDEVQAAGYHWIELGPYGYLPTDPHELADELEKRDLALSGGFVFTGFHKGEEQWRRAYDQAFKVARLIRELGGENLIVIPDMWRSETDGQALEARTLTPEQWGNLAERHDRFGEALLGEYGVKQQFHPHADTHIGSYREVVRLLESTDPKFLNLCLDTGHFAYYGGDSVRLIGEHPDRIGYLHLKQIDPELRFEVLKNDIPFADSAGDMMVEPPTGEPAFQPIIDAVAAINPGTFAIVEQDMPGVDIEVPVNIAVRTRQHIFSCTPMARIR